MKKLLGLLLTTTATLTACGGNAASVGLKQHNDKYLVATIGGEDVMFYADDLYEGLLETASGRAAVMDRVQREVVKEAFIARLGQSRYDSILDEAGDKKDSLIDEYKDLYEAEYDTELETLWKGVGAKDLDDYVEYYIMNETVVLELDKLFKNDYAEDEDNTTDDKDVEMLTELQRETIEAYLDMYTQYDTSHILVNLGGTIQDPTIDDDQASSLASVCESIANNEDFRTIAKEQSDDTGSAEKWGSLGLMDINTSFVPEYLYNSFAGNWGSRPNFQTGNSGYTNTGDWTGAKGLHTTDDGFNNVECQDLDNPLLTEDERNAMLYAFVGDYRTGGSVAIDGAGAVDVVRSEHGLHFITNTTIDTPAIMAQIDTDFKNGEELEDFKYNPESILSQYWGSFASNYYYDLFVSGKVGYHPVATEDVTKYKLDVKFEGEFKSLFDNYSNNIMEATHLSNIKSFEDGFYNWTDSLYADKYDWGYNNKIDSFGYDIADVEFSDLGADTLSTDWATLTGGNY